MSKPFEALLSDCCLYRTSESHEPRTELL